MSHTHCQYVQQRSRVFPFVLSAPHTACSFVVVSSRQCDLALDKNTMWELCWEHWVGVSEELSGCSHNECILEVEKLWWSKLTWLHISLQKGIKCCWSQVKWFSKAAVSFWVDPLPGRDFMSSWRTGTYLSLLPFTFGRVSAKTYLHVERKF